MTMTYDHATLSTLLQHPAGRPPFPTWTERDVWDGMRGARVPQQIIQLAHQVISAPTPALRATDYLAFQREGWREPWERQVDQRRDRLICMTLAECLEGTGRFADPILNEAWAICEESTWVTSAHSWEYPHDLFDPHTPLIDLWSAITAFTLAEVDYLLGDLLHPALRTRIRHEVLHRSTLPFLERNDFRWLGYGSKPINNWLPVCAGGTANAALYLEADPERLAAVIEKTIDGMQRYLATFGADGACAEGVGYWEKGFFFYTAFADLLHARTNGKIDLLEDDHVRQIATFPPKVELSPGKYVAFSDVGLERHPQWALLHFLARRFDLPQLAALDWQGPQQRMLTNRGPGEKLRDLFWYPPTFVPHRIEPAPADYFADTQWLVARATPGDPDGLVLAAKGGYNAEPHNHNDVGSLVVHWQRESLVAELGSGRYTRDYFLDTHRYAYLMNGSQGHSVPVVNGQTQGTGAQYRARDVRYLPGHHQETFVVELAPAYPAEANLTRLERRVVLQRIPAPGSVEIHDYVVFRAGPGTLASVIISFAPATLLIPGEIVLQGVRGAVQLNYDHDQFDAQIEVLPGVELRSGPTDITRVQLELRQPASEARIVVRIVPLVTPGAA